MIKKIINRRIPQILGSYFIAGTSLVLFIEYLVEKYEFPIYLPTMSLIALIGILPSVLILAYFHGAPGKDEWNKIEKVGIPINVLFIGIFILIGNQYNWWRGDLTLEEFVHPRRLTIAHITSNLENINYAMEKSNLKLVLLSKLEKTNIYDELITLLKTNYNSTGINFYTKYQLKEDSNKKGQKTRKYTFKYVQMKFNGINDMLEVHKMAMEDENSLFNYRENTLSDFTYFPLIYKINNLDNKNEYFIFHTLTYIKEIIKDSDTTLMYFDPVIYKTVNEEDIIEEMSEFILKQYRSYVMINNGIIIEILDDNKILFNYNKTKNNIEKRMVFDAIRNYKYKVNTDDFDEFVTSRIDDLINYEYYVDQNPESIFYKNYYNGKGPSENFVGLTNFTKEELTSLLNRTHPFYDYEGQDGMSYGFPIAIDIKIKIEEVYDSTAIASIYKKKDPNIKLRVGDIVKY